MTRWNLAFTVVCACTLVLSGVCQAQSAPTASRSFEPSAFGGITGTYTGLESSRNLGVTAGIDLGFRPFFGLLPAIEVRGTMPLAGGQLVAEKDFLGGLRVQKRFNHVRPYVDVLFGRGELDYQNGGFIVPAQSYRYIQTTSNVISLGIGVELDVTPHFAALIDGQLQHWDIPFSTGPQPAVPGSMYAKAGTIGVVYRFSWLKHGHPAP